MHGIDKLIELSTLRYVHLRRRSLYGQVQGPNGSSRFIGTAVDRDFSQQSHFREASYIRAIRETGQWGLIILTFLAQLVVLLLAPSSSCQILVCQSFLIQSISVLDADHSLPS